MSWKTIYADKIKTGEEAMQLIKKDDLIVIADFCAEPVYLIEKMVERAKQVGHIRVAHGGNVGPDPHLNPEMSQYVDFNCFCAVPKSRKAIEEHRADFTPCFFHQWPRLIESLKPDVALIQLSEPDESGYASIGVSSDFTSALPRQAKITIAQVNRNVPRVGSNMIHVNELTCLVCQDEPMVELADSVAGEKEEKIAQFVAPLIHDGDCLQLGRGKLPDYVLSLLHDRKNLSIHSEMISDGAMKLIQAGAVTNKNKRIHPGKTVCSMAAGSAEFYRWLDNNPDVELLPVDYTNNPAIIAQIDNVVSINSALEVDLLGQVVADMIGPKQYTGIGEFTDFVRGAAASKGGRSIVAFAATAAGGKTSRIVPYVTKGAAIAATRYDVNYVVTEFGVAQLWGKTVRQRVRELIAIAHPDFRDGLTKYAYDNGLLW